MSDYKAFIREKTKINRERIPINLDYSILGDVPVPEIILDHALKYRRPSGSCFEATELEIYEGRATGSLVTTRLPRHAIPAIINEIGFFAYDDDLDGRVIIFAADSLDKLLSLANNHFKGIFGCAFEYIDKDVDK